MENPPFNLPAGGSPPPPTPPPLIRPPAAAKSQKSRGWMVASLILLVLLAFSLFGNLAQSFMHSLSFSHGYKNTTAREAGPKLDECILEENDSHNKIAVITVDGIISSHLGGDAGNNMVDVIKAQLDRAADDEHVKAVILRVDSPGGEVMASDEIYKAIEDFQTSDPDENGKPGYKGKPVVCSMGSLAASGGYYISAPCRWIVANELTLTGSIGVIMHGINYRGLMDKVGVLPTTYKSGLYKDMLSPDRSPNDIPQGEHVMVQALIDETFEKFKGIVRNGRTQAHQINGKEGQALAADWEDSADGRVVSGKRALDLGLVDQLGNFDDAIERTLKIARIKNANLVEYRERYDLSNFLSLFSQGAQARDIKIDLGLEIPKLRLGCLYFLYEAPAN